MIHLPWVVMEGNSGDLRKEADTLDTVLRAMVGIYKTKFALSEDEIIRLLEEETWFSGREAGEFKFDCTVVEDADDCLLRISNTIRDSIKPDVSSFCNTSVEQMDGQTVIRLEVQQGTSRPYYIAGKGIRPEGVYIRQGASNAPASETVILNMIKESSGNNYEEARSLNQQLTFEYAEKYFADKKIAFGEQQKRTLKLIDKDNSYTNLALLLSDQCMHTIRFAVFEGDSKYVVDGVVTFGYVLPFFLSNFIANIYGYFVNMKATFKGKGTKAGLIGYFVVLFALILFTTWLQGYITAMMKGSSWARTVAAMAAGMVQVAVLFPLEKYVLFREK